MNICSMYIEYRMIVDNQLFIVDNQLFIVDNQLFMILVMAL